MTAGWRIALSPETASHEPYPKTWLKQITPMGRRWPTFNLATTRTEAHQAKVAHRRRGPADRGQHRAAAGAAGKGRAAAGLSRCEEARDEAGADGSDRRIELYFGPARSSFFDRWRYRIS
jgi:hypothetical protein